MSSPGTDTDGSGTSMGDVFVIESTARLMKILSDFGPEDRYTTRLRRSDDHALPVGDHHVIRAARDGLCLG